MPLLIRREMVCVDPLRHACLSNWSSNTLKHDTLTCVCVCVVCVILVSLVLPLLWSVCVCVCVCDVFDVCGGDVCLLWLLLCVAETECACVCACGGSVAGICQSVKRSQRGSVSECVWCACVMWSIYCVYVCVCVCVFHSNSVHKRQTDSAVQTQWCAVVCVCIFLYINVCIFLTVNTLVNVLTHVKHAFIVTGRHWQTHKEERTKERSQVGVITKRNETNARQGTESLCY